ncbi:hypothetical protein VNI00_015873 [Paramarasmius palmivorus]|uniref:Uncharacterized protein n=1 Tax=Paramarasmius palmivorus TaxID=297713 RepID=A0AAW0BHK1_9AGAR
MARFRYQSSNCGERPSVQVISITDEFKGFTPYMDTVLKSIRTSTTTSTTDSGSHSPFTLRSKGTTYFDSSAHQPFSNTSSIDLRSLSDRKLMGLSSEEPQALDNLSTGLLVLGRGLPTSTFWLAKLGSSYNLVCNKNHSNLPSTFVGAFNLKDTENRIKTAPQAFGPVDS